jgi:hypothetical protein
MNSFTTVLDSAFIHNLPDAVGRGTYIICGRRCGLVMIEAAPGDRCIRGLAMRESEFDLVGKYFSIESLWKTSYDTLVDRSEPRLAGLASDRLDVQAWLLVAPKAF